MPIETGKTQPVAETLRLTDWIRTEGTLSPGTSFRVSRTEAGCPAWEADIR